MQARSVVIPLRLSLFGFNASVIEFVHLGAVNPTVAASALVLPNEYGPLKIGKRTSNPPLYCTVTPSTVHSLRSAGKIQS